MLKRLQLHQTNRPMDVLLRWRDDGSLLLSPPYQRGDVWGHLRRQNYIRSLLLGIPMASIILNDRFGADWASDVTYAVIDGKQRCTTILRWFDDSLAVPRAWFNAELLTGSGQMVKWCDLTVAAQRKFKNQSLPFSEGCLPDLETEQEVFELVNFGGLPQGAVDSD